MTLTTLQWLTLFVGATFLGACTPAGKPLPANPSQGWAEAFNKGDAGAIAALYTDDAILLPPGAPLVRGKAAIEAFMVKDAGGGFQIEIVSLETPSQGYTGYNLGTFTVKDANGAVVDTGKYIELWKRANGEWKIYADIYNSDIPPPAPTPAGDESAPATSP
jgi:ketosteroid isomerase-like protein